MATVHIGSRLLAKGSRGTVRYIGTLSGTKGEWIGVEWDDPGRGKHDGSKGGVRYFQCREPLAGSFIRPSTCVDYGQSFLTALRTKYCEDLQGPNESVTLGSSKGAIEVEVVKLDMIRAGLSQLETIREVSLQNVGWVDDPHTIQQTCPLIRGLDLSDCLLSRWTSVEQLCTGLRHLERLYLNRTRLELPISFGPTVSAFESIQELQLNDTNMKWPDFLALEQSFPRLLHAEMGFNALCSLGHSQSVGTNASLRSLNLDSNLLCNWNDVTGMVLAHSSLSRLFLTNNHFAGITIPEPGSQTLSGLKHISLTANRFESWSDIDRLAIWCPNLETLRIRDNPISTLVDTERYHRQMTIAKIASLTELDSAPITASERRDCELFYISFVARLENISEDVRDTEHPRWRELCERWGAPEHAAPRLASQHKLRSQLIDVSIHVRATASVDVPNTEHAVPPLHLRVLRTMTLKMLRAKVLKALKTAGSVPKSTKTLDVSIKMSDDQLLLLETSKDSQEIDWLGVDENAHLYIVCA